MKKFYLLLFLFFQFNNLDAQVTVAGSNGANGVYTSLSNAGGAFDAIDGFNQIGQNITISITANLLAEAGTIDLSAPLGMWNQLTITPSGNRTVSGTITNDAVITFNEADNVTIDGINSGGNALTISNLSNAVGASTLTFLFDALNNTVTNTTILGSGTNASNAVIYFSIGTTTGNDGNTISNCNVSSSSGGLPTNGLLSAWSAGPGTNDNNTVTNCNFFDYNNSTASSRGIYLSTGNGSWTITSNRFYQTASRTLGASLYSAIYIFSGDGHTVSNNFVGGTNVAGTGTMTYTSAVAATYVAIYLSTAAVNPNQVNGNTVTNISFSTASNNTATPGIFTGIFFTGGTGNIGTTAGNTIGSGSGTGAITISSTSAGSSNYCAGIAVSSSANVVVQNNTIGGINCPGTANILYQFYGIDLIGAGSHTVSSNTIGSTTTANSITVGTVAVTTSATTVIGIRNTSSGSVTIGGPGAGNTIQNITSYSTSALALTYGIHATNGTGILTINNNNVIAVTVYGGSLICVLNSAVPATLNINNNVFRNISIQSGAAFFYGILNSSAVTAAININNNQLGNATGGLINYAVSSTSQLAGIVNNGAASTASLSIQNNDIRGITYTANASHANLYISNAGAALTQNISNNTFTALSIATSGSISFIQHASTLPAGGSKTLNNNRIVTSFTKTLGPGTVTCLTVTGSSPAGTTNTVTNNDFSNVTLTGAVFTGINVTDAASAASSPVKTVTGNTINAVTTTSTTTLINVTNVATNSTISSNTVTGITMSGSYTAINVSGGTGATYTISYNKVGNIESTSAFASFAEGIYATTGSAYIYNNIVGDLRVSAAPSGTPSLVTAINLSSNTLVNLYVYYNSIYLNAAGSATNFGTSGLYVYASATIDLRNNIIVNTSTAGSNATSFTVAYRRTGTTLTTHSSVSNNNLFYAGAPGVKNLVFYDGTNGDQTVPAFISRLGTGAETNSISENPPFLSTAGSNASFLHINTASATQIESGGATISTPISITNDFNVVDVRCPGGGCPGAGTKPDIGADEMTATIADLTPPGIGFNTSLNNTGTASPYSPGSGYFTITDAGTGVNTTAGTRPRLYYKKCSDNNAIVGNTSADNGWKYVEATVFSPTTFTFSINYSLLYNFSTSIKQGTILNYFIVAQDNKAPTPNVGISNGLSLAGSPTSVNLATGNLPSGTLPVMIIQFSTGGTISAGTGGEYINITGDCGCFRASNASATTMTGDVTLSILTNITEDNVHQLSSTGPTPRTINIVPATAGMKIISGSVGSGSPAFTTLTNMIGVTGTAILNVNGDFGGVKSLTFRNETATPANTGPVFKMHNFVGGGNPQLAVSNAVLENNSSDNSLGIVYVFGPAGISAATSLTVTNCDIRDSRGANAGRPYNAISVSNSANPIAVNITNNNIYNFLGSGVNTYYSGITTISGNSFYQEAARTDATNFVLNLGNTAGGGPFTISNNFIGGSAPNCGGTAWVNSNAANTFHGIYLYTATGTSSISGNTIQNINLTGTGTTTFYGIRTGNSTAAIANITNNTIGHASNANSITNSGTNSVATPVYTVGININSSSNTTASGNTIANITASGTGSQVSLKGIWNQSTGTTQVLSNNNIYNLSSASTATAQTAAPGAAVAGIQNSSGSTAHTISGNTIYNLNTTTASAVNVFTLGIITGQPSAGNIFNNKIYGLGTASTGATPRIAGIGMSIQTSSANTWNIYNNMIALNNNGNATNPYMCGIRDFSGVSSGTAPTNNYYYNSIHIYGTASGSNNSYAFVRDNSTGGAAPVTVKFRNNIFQNMRTGGTGSHYAIANITAGTLTTGWPAFAGVVGSGYNNLYSSNSATVGEWAAGTARTFALWNTSSNGDPAPTSKNVQAFFNDPSTGDLHLNINKNCTLNGAATPITTGGGHPLTIGTDYDADTRDATTPDIGADEFVPDVAPTSSLIYQNPGGPNCTTYSEYISTVCTAMNDATWHDFVDDNGKVIASINPNNSDLGTVTVTIYQDASYAHNDLSNYSFRYMGRVWKITITGSITPGSEPHLRLYYKAADQTGLNTAASCTSCVGADLVVVQSSNLAAPNEDCDATNNSAHTLNFYWFKNPTSGYTLQRDHIAVGVNGVITPNYYGSNLVAGNIGYTQSNQAGFDGNYIQINRLPSFSEFRISEPTLFLLTSKILTFAASKNATGNLLSFTATCAAASAEFEVERSADGRNFTAIHSFSATQERCSQPFELKDELFLKGINYYRIRMKDAAGTVVYSAIQQVNRTDKGFGWITLFPNVTTGFTNLTINTPKATRYTVHVISTDGRIVLQKEYVLQPGNHRLPLDVSTLPGGAYFVRCNSNEQGTETLTLIKQ